MIQTRLQKERDTFHEECEKLQERLELQQSQLTKAQRDRENMHTEMEVFRDRWEKAQQNQQKLQVEFGLSVIHSFYFLGDFKIAPLVNLRLDEIFTNPFQIRFSL